MNNHKQEDDLETLEVISENDSLLNDSLLDDSLLDDMSVENLGSDSLLEDFTVDRDVGLSDDNLSSFIDDSTDILEEITPSNNSLEDFPDIDIDIDDSVLAEIKELENSEIQELEPIEPVNTLVDLPEDNFNQNVIDSLYNNTLDYNEELESLDTLDEEYDTTHNSDDLLEGIVVQPEIDSNKLEEINDVVKVEEERDRRLRLRKANRTPKKLKLSVDYFNELQDTVSELFDTYIAYFKSNENAAKKAASSIIENFERSTSVHSINDAVFNVAHSRFKELCDIKYDTHAGSKDMDLIDIIMNEDLSLYRPTLYQLLSPDVAKVCKDKGKISLSYFICSDYDRLAIIEYFSNLEKTLVESTNIYDRLNDATTNFTSRVRSKYLNLSYKDYNKDNYCFVKYIIRGKENRFICGDCGKENKTVRPFVQIGIFPMADTKYEIIPHANICSCGKSNILSEYEIKRLRESFNAKEKTNMKNIGSQAKALTDTFNFTSYEFGQNQLNLYVPDLYTFEEMDATVIEEVAHEEEIGGYEEAIKQYKGLLLYFKSTKSFNVQIEESEQKSEVDEMLDEVVPDNNSKVDTPIEILDKGILSNKSVDKWRVVSEAMTNYLGLDYYRLKQNAINSLLNYISETPLYTAIKLEVTEIKRAKLFSRDYVETALTLEHADIVSTITETCTALDLSVNDYLDSNDEYTKDSLERFKNDSTKAFDSLEDDLKETMDLRETLINKLEDMVRLYSFVPISNINVRNEEVVENLYYDKRIINFIEQTTNFMLMNHISENYMNLWISLKGNIDRQFTKISDLSYDPKTLSYSIGNLITKCGISLGTSDNEKYYGILTPYFNSLHSLNITELSKLINVRDAIITFDTYDFMRAVSQCNIRLHGDPVEITGDSSYVAPLFRSIESILRSMKAESMEFMQSYSISNNNNINKLYYYIGTEFSDAEIKESYIRGMKVPEYHRTLVRKHKETLSDYIKRWDTIIEDTTVDGEFEPADDGIYNKVKEHVDVLSICSAPCIYLVSEIKNIQNFLCMSDFIYYIKDRPLDNILEILCINPSNINRLKSDDKEVTQERPDYDKIVTDTWLLNSIYPVAELNEVTLQNDVSKNTRIAILLGNLTDEDENLEEYVNTGRVFDRYCKNMNSTMKQHLFRVYSHLIDEDKEDMFKDKTVVVLKELTTDMSVEKQNELFGAVFNNLTINKKVGQDAKGNYISISEQENNFLSDEEIKAKININNINQKKVMERVMYEYYSSRRH